MADGVVDKIRAFNRFYTSFIGLTNQHILRSEFSLTELRVMFEANHNPGVTARQLKTELRIDEGYLSRLISKLVKKNILSKNPLKEDKRAHRLQLTPKGKKIFQTLNKRSSENIAALIKHLNDPEKKKLLAHLNSAWTLLTKGKKE